MRYYISGKQKPVVYKVQNDVIVWQSVPQKDNEQASKLIDSLRLEDSLGVK